jgi:hypothetical protein
VTPPLPIPSRATLWQAAGFPLAVFAAHRAALLGIATFGPTVIRTPFAVIPTPVTDSALPAALAGLCRWDCGMYVNLALRGYAHPSESPVFPLFPMVAGALHRLTGMPAVYAVLGLANAFGALALVLAHAVFARLGGRVAARNAVLLWAAFPFTFFHAAGYAESMALCLAALAVHLALASRFAAAGLALALGCATRHVDLLAGATLLSLLVRARGTSPRALLLHRDALALLLPPFGVLAYALYCKLRWGDPWAFAVWRTQCDTGFWRVRAWWSVAEAFRDGRPRTEPVLATYVLWSLVPGVGALALLTRRAWRPLAPYALLLMALYWQSGLMGLGRFSASCWPAFLPLGWTMARRPAPMTALLLVMAVAQGMYFLLWSRWFGMF